MKAWEGRMVSYGKDSKTYRIWESGTKVAESRNVTFIKILPVKPNVFGHDHNDGDDDTFLDLESSCISLRTQEELPETEAATEPDIGDSQSGGTINNVNEESDSDMDEESDSDIDGQPCKAANEKHIVRQLRHSETITRGPHRPTEQRFIRLLSTTHILSAIRSLTHQTRAKSHPREGTTGNPWRQRKLRSGKYLWKGSLKACPNTTSMSWLPHRRGARLFS